MYWVFIIILLARTVENQSNDCISYTINHNYPQSEFTNNNNDNNDNNEIRRVQGPPGKRGPIGIRGEKGEVGDTGPSGPLIDPLVLQRIIDERIIAITGIVKTCAYKEPGTPSGNYLINPQPTTMLPFLVYCNFSDPQNPATVFGNEFLTEQPVTNCENYKCSNQEVNYETEMRNIVSVMDSSVTCRQYIKLRCIGSMLFGSTSTPYGAWVSRDGEDRHYWGGASRDFYCACGESGTCDDSTKKCNCDKNTGIETTDEGYLTNKDHLPVIGLKHGDTGDSNEKAWHTLGMLECFGKA